jgi:osmotically-inducible protein OsmY
MKKASFVITVLLFCSVITSCVPLVIGGAGAVVATSIVYDRRSVKTMMQDREIASQAQMAISDDLTLQGRSHISVIVFNHNVLLIGQVQTPELRARVYQIVHKLPRVKKIYNQLVISGVTTDLARTDDAWITTKVKAALLMQKGLHSLQLKIVTENGVVYLMGIVSHQQANLAVDVARRVRGVKKVVKVFEYRV